jgi:hypothetical protein
MPKITYQGVNKNICKGQEEESRAIKKRSNRMQKLLNRMKRIIRRRIKDVWKYIFCWLLLMTIECIKSGELEKCDLIIKNKTLGDTDMINTIFLCLPAREKLGGNLAGICVEVTLRHLKLRMKGSVFRL